MQRPQRALKWSIAVAVAGVVLALLWWARTPVLWALAPWLLIVGRMTAEWIVGSGRNGRSEPGRQPGGSGPRA